MDYIGLVGLITLVSQTLLSRWLAIGWITLDWLDPYHRPTEAAVRQIGLTDAAHERMVTHIGLGNTLVATLHSQPFGHAHRFCTRSSHALKTRKRFCHVRWIPKLRSHCTPGLVHSQTLLSQTQVSQTLLFTNTGLTNVPHERKTHNALSRSWDTQTLLSQSRLVNVPLTHTGLEQAPVKHPGFANAAVTKMGFTEAVVLYIWFHRL